MSARINLRRLANRARGRDRWTVPVTELRVRTEDGVDLAVSRLGAGGGPAVVVAHALLGYRTKPPWRRLSEALAQRFTVYAVDLRGHGDSSGVCTGGPLEALDVRAVIRKAREDGCSWVGTVGGSLGAAAAIFEGASSGLADLVCAISPPARWVAETLHLPSADDGLLRRRLLWVFNSKPAQVGAEILFGVRFNERWIGAEPPADVVDRIAPTPLFVIHGEDDHLFPVSTVREMMDLAGEPKRLWLREGFGHCEDGFDDEFCAWLRETLEAAALGHAGREQAR